MGWVGDEVMPVYVGVNAWLGMGERGVGDHSTALKYKTRFIFISLSISKTHNIFF